MTFKVFRNCDARFHLRKVVVELFDIEGCLLDKRRMFAGPLFSFRLKLKQKRMARLGKKMLAGSYSF